ncbi:unnamed protein product [Amoebophrya sp. A25]|nr:unnamed protein product [Amoebophrya sp. A25]|eukprot:GSA25T00022269001.1
MAAKNNTSPVHETPLGLDYHYGQTTSTNNKRVTSEATGHDVAGETSITDSTELGGKNGTGMSNIMGTGLDDHRRVMNVTDEDEDEDDLASSDNSTAAIGKGIIVNHEAPLEEHGEATTAKGRIVLEDSASAPKDEALLDAATAAKIVNTTKALEDGAELNEDKLQSDGLWVVLLAMVILCAVMIPLWFGCSPGKNLARLVRRRALFERDECGPTMAINNNVSGEQEEPLLQNHEDEQEEEEEALLLNETIENERGDLVRVGDGVAVHDPSRDYIGRPIRVNLAAAEEKELHFGLADTFLAHEEQASKLLTSSGENGVGQVHQQGPTRDERTKQGDQGPTTSGDNSEQGNQGDYVEMNQWVKK